MFKNAIKIGVPIAFGTDAGVFPHGMNAKEFGLMTEVGMTPTAALLSGTREAAKLLGVDAEIGTLEAGKIADVVAVPGDVLANIRATETPDFRDAARAGDRATVRGPLAVRTVMAPKRPPERKI